MNADLDIDRGPKYTAAVLAIRELQCAEQIMRFAPSQSRAGDHLMFTAVTRISLAIGLDAPRYKGGAA